ncbi:MAG: AAA family ATPase [Pseudonocardia sp.]|nr:AAA family ATPase [Pseudonocardia sp.]
MVVSEPFVGRSDELALLHAVLTHADAAQPRVVLIDGPAGIGKTTLVDRFLQSHPDVRTLRARGEQWESLIACGVIDQLLRSAATEHAGPPERIIATHEPFAVGARVLEFWGELQDRSTLVVVIDDLQWADADSLRALLFATRRLTSEHVMIVLVVRDDDIDQLPDGLRRLAATSPGTRLTLGPLPAAHVRELARALGSADLLPADADRLQIHTAGNPLHVKALLSELPSAVWREGHTALPAPRSIGRLVAQRLASAPHTVRLLVGAAAVLGVDARLQTVARVADTPAVLEDLDEAVARGLLREEKGPGRVGHVTFAHPLVQSAVYDQLPPTLRARLHLAAAKATDDDGAALRHRAAAAIGPDPGLTGEIEAFARRSAAAGAWSNAASALITGAELSATRAERQQLTMRAIDATVNAGDVRRAEMLMPEIGGVVQGPSRNAVLGYLALLSGRVEEAEKRLSEAWNGCDPLIDPTVAAAVAQRRAMHAGGRLHGQEMIEWGRQALTLGTEHGPVRADAGAILGIGLGWMGQADEGWTVHASALAELPDADGTSGGLAASMANGWLRLATDDIEGARRLLEEAAPAALRRGSYRVAVYAFSWLARARYYCGDWDRAVVDADRAVTLLDDTQHEWLRPLVRWSAIGVPAARGDWATASEHARLAHAHGGNHEIMIAGCGLARAQLLAARGDHHGVVRVLEPLLAISPRDALDEPGFWPFHDLYAEALVGVGRSADADRFLVPHERKADKRGRRSVIARLARARGRIEAARGNAPAANAAFERGLAELPQTIMPFERALLELAYGQVLRRHGQRRAAGDRLEAARDRLDALRARPYLEQCERELVACGLTPADRQVSELHQLTAQELAVARLVAEGATNRQVATELLVSIKTVQSHLTRIYAKVGVNSRTALSARLRADERDRHPAQQGAHPSQT